MKPLPLIFALICTLGCAKSTEKEDNNASSNGEVQASGSAKPSEWLEDINPMTSTMWAQPRPNREDYAGLMHACLFAH